MLIPSPLVGEPNLGDLLAAVVDDLHSFGVLREIREHFQEELPIECVGLVWEDGQVDRLTNQARSSTRFAVSMPQLVEVMGARQGIVIAIYHSHPAGSTGLSWEDQFSLRTQFGKGIPIPWLVVTETAATVYALNEAGDIEAASIPQKNGLVHV